MNRFAALLALSVMQQEAPAGPAAPPDPAPAEKTERPVAPPAPPAPVPLPDPKPIAAPVPAAAPARPEPTVPPPAPAAPRAPSSPASAPVPRAPPPPPQPAPPPRLQQGAAVVAPPRSDRERALRAALSFLDALLRGDAARLAAASTARFNFDGDQVDGPDAQARRWRELFARRPASGGALRDLVLLTAPEAVSQLGPPPAGVAGLLDPATWVAVANLSERPVVLFLVRDGDRWAVAGMHD